MKKVIFTIMMSCIAVLAMAQKTVITGVLVDSTLQEAEPYATVRIFKVGKQQKPAAMGLTDLEGRFRQEVNGSGKYIVQLSSVGKHDAIRQITLGKEQTIDLGTILISEDAQMLKGVEIIAQKPLVKMEGDKVA
jgi:hypothetical protein